MFAMAEAAFRNSAAVINLLLVTVMHYWKFSHRVCSIALGRKTSFRSLILSGLGCWIIFPEEEIMEEIQGISIALSTLLFRLTVILGFVYYDNAHSAFASFAVRVP